MYLDQHTEAHRRFAAYQNSPYQDYMDWYQNSDYYKNELSERQQSAGYERQLQDENNDYRNRALSQQGSLGRAQIGASRANAQLAASTQLKSQKMQIDARYQEWRTRLDELEIPSFRLDAWYKQQQVGLARAELQLKARGPENAFQYSAAMGEATGTPIPASIRALQRNQPFTPGTPSGTPEPMTFEKLARQVGLDPGTGPAGDAAVAGMDAANLEREKASLEAIRPVAANPGALAPGVYESLPDFDKAIFDSGLEKLGYSAPDWHQRRQMVGIGQGSARAA